MNSNKVGIHGTIFLVSRSSVRSFYQIFHKKDNFFNEKVFLSDKNLQIFNEPTSLKKSNRYDSFYNYFMTFREIKRSDNLSIKNSELER